MRVLQHTLLIAELQRAAHKRRTYVYAAGLALGSESMAICPARVLLEIV